jgi:copper homeostasis protein
VVLVEAAIDSARDAERAVREGAHRLEVCAALDLGGLTPAPGLLRECLALGVPCVAMVRPRAGDFVYDAGEIMQLRADAASLRETGAHGLVVGALTADARVDASVIAELVARHHDAEIVFHRAFDRCHEPREALASLIECGVRRVLTSGCAADAASGTDTLALLVRRSAGRIEILAGGGVRALNVASIVRRTGVSQVHARGSEPGVIAGIVAALGGAPQRA